MERRKAIEALLREHFERRPRMRASDFYKLLFQGVFGVGHILGEGAWKRLQEEAESIDVNSHPSEPLIEKISTDSSMVRVNLRPYLKLGFPLVVLFEAMIETAKKQGPTEKFLLAWSVFCEIVSSGAIKVNGEELDLLNRELQKEGPRPHHHSEPYKDAYYPAYRVVERGAFEKIHRFQ
jgi:hypothetical protein